MEDNLVGVLIYKPRAEVCRQLRKDLLSQAERSRCNWADNPRHLAHQT